jgi:hypothetical protein
MRSEPFLLRLLFWPFVPLVGHPERIAAAALLWLIAAATLTFWRKKFAWPPLVTGTVWAAYAAWEWYCVRMGYNIRVDMFLVAPLLLAFTIFGVGGLFVADPAQFRLRRQFSLRSLMIVMTVAAIGLGLLAWLASSP